MGHFIRTSYGAIARASIIESSLQLPRGSDAAHANVQTRMRCQSNPVKSAMRRMVAVGSASSLSEQLNMVLRYVKCGIAHERLRIDHQPGLAPRPQNISSVQIGREENLCWRCASQLLKEVQACAYQSNVRPGCLPCLCFVAPKPEKRR